ncbi:MAG: hypothetical protein V3T86_07755 [Planctomycetota bacterium]
MQQKTAASAIFAFCLLVPLNLALAKKPESPTLAVPFGAVATLDGDIAAAEWKGAVKLELGGSSIRAQHDGKTLSLGVRGGSAGFLSLFIRHKERVYVLHASARLGTAVYEKKGDRFELKRGFEYEKPSDEFLKREGWRATTMKQGNPVMECLVDLKKFGVDPAAKDANARTLRVAVVHGFPGMPGAKVTAWPKKLGDATGNQKLILGHTPSSLAFSCDAWATLVIAVQPKK